MLLNTDGALACGAVPLPHRVHDVHGKGSLYCNGPNSHGLQELDLVLVVLLLQVGLDDGHGALVEPVVAHGDLVARLRPGLLWDAVCGRPPDKVLQWIERVPQLVPRPAPLVPARCTGDLKMVDVSFNIAKAGAAGGTRADEQPRSSLLINRVNSARRR